MSADVTEIKDESAKWLSCTEKPKSIAVVGRARVGKSRIVTLFARNDEGYFDFFVEDGSDKTKCTVNNHFIDSEEGEEFIICYSDFELKDKDKDASEANAEMYALLNKKINVKGEEEPKPLKELLNSKIAFENKEEIKEVLNLISSIIRFEENKDAGLEKSNTYIDVYLKPSEYCKAIMDKSETKHLLITDTPGVSGNVAFVNIPRADLYVFVMRNDNTEEADKSFKTIVDGLKANIATSDVCFLYQMSNPGSTPEMWEDLNKDAKEAMKKFGHSFKELQENAIATVMDIVYPEKYCIGVPVFTKPKFRSANEAGEQFFKEAFKERILKALSSDKSDGILNDYNDQLKSIKNNEVSNVSINDVRLYIEDVLSHIGEHDYASYREDFFWVLSSPNEDGSLPLKDYKSLIIANLVILDRSYYLNNSYSSTSYSKDKFLKEHHNRVKTGDGHRIVKRADLTRDLELDVLCGYFSQFKTADFEKRNEEWKIPIVRYLYHKLTATVKSDRGLGVGKHPFEDKTPVTMRVEESVLAEEIRTMVLKKTIAGEKNYADGYVETLEENGIESGSYNYVHCVGDDEWGLMLVKLALIVNSNLSVPVVSCPCELILKRYIGGLRKLAEYEILIEFYADDNACKRFVCGLPF